MIAHPEKPARLFYPGWVVFSAAAVGAGGWIAWRMMALVVQLVGDTLVVDGQRRITEDFLFLYILLPVIGLVSGMVQALWLKGALPHLKGWALATLVSWLLPFGVGAIFSGILSSIAGDNPTWVVLGLMLMGAFMGLPQWLVLRRQAQRGWLWLAGMAAGWGMVAVFNRLSNEPMAVLAAIALLPALTTALAWWLMLAWLPKRSQTVNDA